MIFHNFERSIERLTIWRAAIAYMKRYPYSQRRAHVVHYQLGCRRYRYKSWVNIVFTAEILVAIVPLDSCQTASAHVFFNDGVDRVPYHHSRVPESKHNKTSVKERAVQQRQLHAPNT